MKGAPLDVKYDIASLKRMRAHPLGLCFYVRAHGHMAYGYVATRVRVSKGGACLMATETFGETPARRALRENTVAVTEAVQRNLNVLPRHLMQKAFMTASHSDEIASTSGVSNAHKANGIMRAVEGKINSGNYPERGRKWFKEFLVILMQQDIGEYEVAQDMAKVYSESVAVLSVYIQMMYYVTPSL